MVRLRWMEIEDKKQITLLVDDDFAHVVLGRHVLVLLDHGFESYLYLVHFFVESVEVAVSKIFVVHQVPLTTTMLITISITFSREIDPFGMTEFIAHEVEVPFATERLRK